MKIRRSFRAICVYDAEINHGAKELRFMLQDQSRASIMPKTVLS